MGYIADHHDKLMKEITDEQKETFEKFSDCYDELTDINEGGIINGGNVVSLSKLLGHSSLDITQNYINLLVSEVAKQVDEFNVLDKFYGRTHIPMEKA